MNFKCESKNDNLVMNITSCLQSMNISEIDEIFFFSLERYLRLSSWIIFLKLINFDNGKWLILIIRVLPKYMRFLFEENVLGNILWRYDNIPVKMRKYLWRHNSIWNIMSNQSSSSPHKSLIWRSQNIRNYNH